MRIEPNRWYKPSEITKLGLILNSRNRADINFVLRLIRRKLLQANNYATQTKPYWRVLGSEIIRYKTENEGFTS